MIRHPVPSAEAGQRRDAGDTAFVNPWADCWGKAKQRASLQMQAEQRAMAPSRMEKGAVAEIGSEPCDESLPAARDGVHARVLPVINNTGLHARASAKFVQTVERFKAEVKVSRCGETVGGLSIMGLMMLAAARGTSITVEASGEEAAACLDAIEALLADKFGEEA
jgi:phosphocarrier protein HPr